MLEAFTALSGGMEDLQAEPPAALHDNVMAEIRRENRKPVLIFTKRSRQLAAVAVLAVVLLAGLSAAARSRADKAAGALTMAAVTADEVAENTADSYPAAGTEVEMYSMPAAAQMAPEAAQNGLQMNTVSEAAKSAARADTAPAANRGATESEPMELTEAQAAILLSALGEATDARAAGEPLRLSWTDADGTTHTAAMYDNICVIDGTNYGLIQSKDELIDNLTQ